MQSHTVLNRMIAAAVLRGDWRPETLERRVAELLGKRYRWVRPLVQRLDQRFGAAPSPKLSQIAAFLAADKGWRRVLKRSKLKISDWLLVEPEHMHPIAAANAWQLPEITTQGQMAQWSGVSSGELSWLADIRIHHASGSGAQAGVPASHYRNHFVRKRSGTRQSPDLPLAEPQAIQFCAAGGKVRLIEAPKPKLKSLQRSILYEILDRVPPHLACCGFRQGSSILDYVAPHVGKCSVLKMDLRDFYPSITFKRVYAVYASLGFPHPISQLLTRLSTTATPTELWEGCQASQHLRYLQSLYTVRHLPQGAPTSPALANLVAYRLDCRLTGLAQRAGVDYTRYADDLAFSGGQAFRRQAGRFSISVAAIIMEEGFRVNYRKTRIMHASTSQRLVGLVINQRPNVARSQYDRLKAILTNCIRLGPESQNRDGHPDFRRHLAGKLAFLSMIHAERGQKLQKLFDKVCW